jgi:hypothetical protein
VSVEVMRPAGSAEVVRCARELVEAAERGEVVGVVLVAVQPGRVHVYRDAGDVSEADLALAAADLLTIVAERRRTR